MNQRASQNVPTHNAPSTNNRPGKVPAMNGRSGNIPSMSHMTPRQQELSQNRPPSAMNNSNRAPASVMGNAGSQRTGNSPHTWEAQGNAQERGRAPAGCGSSYRPTTTVPAQAERMHAPHRHP